MYIWEWRRRWRQAYRNWRPIPNIDYKALTKRYAEFCMKKIVVAFVLFFIGWKSLGLLLTDKILWRYDEKLGKMRMFEVREVKEMQQAEIENEMKKEKITLPIFSLDD